MRKEEQHEAICGSEERRTHVAGVAFPVAESALRALNDFASGNTHLVSLVQSLQCIGRRVDA